MAYFAAISHLHVWEGEPPALSALAEALRASWDAGTAYRGHFTPANPAGGQCYPTSRVVQWFYPDFEVASGEVWTGTTIERHFWNVRDANGAADTIDLSWEQFPAGSKLGKFEVLRTGACADSKATQDRCVLLLDRVSNLLRRRPGP